MASVRFAPSRLARCKFALIKRALTRSARHRVLSSPRRSASIGGLRPSHSFVQGGTWTSGKTTRSSLLAGVEITVSARIKTHITPAVNRVIGRRAADKGAPSGRGRGGGAFLRYRHESPDPGVGPPFPAA